MGQRSVLVGLLGDATASSAGQHLVSGFPGYVGGKLSETLRPLSLKDIPILQKPNPDHGVELTFMPE